MKLPLAVLLLSLATLAVPAGIAPGLDDGCPDPGSLHCYVIVINGNPFMIGPVQPFIKDTPLYGNQLTIGVSNSCDSAVSTSGETCAVRVCYSPWDVTGCDWIPVPYTIPGLP